MPADLFSWKILPKGQNATLWIRVYQRGRREKKKKKRRRRRKLPCKLIKAHLPAFDKALSFFTASHPVDI